MRPGSLLVSSVELAEPTFRRSVVYVIEHNDAGTLGVVLNRPSRTPLGEVLPQWTPLAAEPGTVYIGGPVKRDAALCLATLRMGIDIDDIRGIRRVSGRTALVDLDAAPSEIAEYVEVVRVFIGYAGWSMGQLDGELESGDWLVLSALPGDTIGTDRQDLWARILRRQPMPTALLATHPIEVERN